MGRGVANDLRSISRVQYGNPRLDWVGEEERRERREEGRGKREEGSAVEAVDK
jgi:hypothetical protein